MLTYRTNENLLRLIRRALIYVNISLISIPFIFPFYWMFVSSGKTYAEIFTFPPALFPKAWQWANYKTAFTYLPYFREYINSIYIAVIVTVCVLFIASLSGYAFARIKFSGNSFFFLLLLSALMMPGEVTIIPNFVLMQTLKLTDTHIPLLILPIFGAAGVVGTFIMRQSFLGFPSELEDAARLDGLNRFGIYLKIALPLSRSALSTVAVITFLRSWSLFLEPLIFLNSKEKFTLPIALISYIDPMGNPLLGPQFAATTLSVIPVLLFFFIAQENIVESFATTGTKG